MAIALGARLAEAVAECNRATPISIGGYFYFTSTDISCRQFGCFAVAEVHAPVRSDKLIASGSPSRAWFPIGNCSDESRGEARSMKHKKELRFDPKVFLLSGNRAIFKYEKGQLIFQQGDLASSVFYIQTGRVKLAVTSEQGKEAVVAILADDDFFGEGCAGAETLRWSSATALLACTIVQMGKAEIRELIHEEPTFSEFFISHLLVRSSHVQADLIDRLFNSSEKRLARTLLLLANFGKEGEPQPVLAKISQETLAEIVGTTRSRVNFFMNKFRRLGLIDYNGQIEVHRSLLNMVLHEKPEVKS
jgi:CRP/FNR family cyclic AMP-dependent transcriptional regulator